MTPQEYNGQVDEIYREADARLHRLRLWFVEENAEFKIGDFIYNVTGIIKVDKITYEMFGNEPVIVYKGLRYKKVKGELIRTKDNNISTLIHNLKIIYNFENIILP